MASFKVGALKGWWCLCAFAGEDQGDVWESNAGWTPQHCQVPQVLAGYEGESGAGVYVFLFSFFTHSENTLNPPLSISSQVIFITEYMSSGSLKQFLKKTKKNHKTMNVKVSFCLCSQSVCLWWRSRVLQPRPIRHRIVDYVTKNWSVGFLKIFCIKFKMHNVSCFRPGRDGVPRFCLPSGMVFTWIFFPPSFPLLLLKQGTLPACLLFPGSYLHSCDPPIIHGNLTCDTIFIQHNGLIKIGSGLPPPGIFMLLQPAFAAHSVAEISQFFLIFFLQCGIGCSLMVRNRAF